MDAAGKFLQTCYDRLFEGEVFYLTSARARMLLKLYQKVGNLFQSGFVATVLDNNKFLLGLIRK
jgi:hypothetical protein